VQGIERVDFMNGDAPAPTADIVIKGTFKELSSGSRALRFWVGFGAGTSFCHVEMEGLDQKSGAQAFSIEHARGSALDIIADDEVLENIDEVVRIDSHKMLPKGEEVRDR
jgi:hypothetical protein